MSTDSLFAPFRIPRLALKNRIVMAPMTRSLSPGGVAPPEVADYYARRAAGGVGLILTEATVIDRPSSRNDPNTPAFHGEAALRSWKHIANTVHSAGGVIAPQLWHVGSLSNPAVEWTPPAPPESPSGLARRGRPHGRIMTEEDIDDTIAAFARAAAVAKGLGFDAVEIHGAHGYLIDQYFWAELNNRQDRYGGPSIRARSRFAVEVIRATRKAVGQDFCILFRISQWKAQDFAARIANSPEELEQWLAPLAEAGVDIFDCSQRRFWEPEFAGSELNLAGWTKRITGLPTVTVGSVGLSGEFIAAWRGERSQPASLDKLLRRLERGEFDLVAVGRALLNDPNWVEKIRDGRIAELQPFAREALSRLY